MNDYQSTTSKPVSPEARVMTAEGRYDELCSYRSPFLWRARQAAELTIPALMPPEGDTAALQFVTPFQSVGARGVNNLAAKLLLALFPPGSSFFRLTVDPYMLEKLVGQAQAEGDDPTAEIEEALGRVERAVITRMEQKNTRTTLYETFRHLINDGNALLHVIPKGSLKLYHLNKYVVKRDLEGNPVELVVRECLSPRTLPAAARAIYADKGEKDSQKDNAKNTIYLYTWVRLDTDETKSGRWKVHQELLGEIVPDTEGHYPKDKSPFIALRWTQVYGEDYGRGMVEEYMGDLRSCESLSQSIVEFAAIASKVLFLVNEGGITQKKKLAEAPSGAVVDGDAKDVTVLTLEKFADFQVAKATRDEIKHDLAQAFLLNSSVQRQAERVTAEEIRFMAGELEQALGGTYSLLAEELQRPLVVRLMLQMQKERELPHLPENLVSPQIITGLEGLGRSSDEMKLRMLIQGIAQDVGPEAVAEYINVGGLISRRATALGIDTKGLVRSEEEVQQSRQQQMMQQMTEKLGPSGIKAMSDQAKVEAQEQQSAEVPQQQ